MTATPASGEDQASNSSPNPPDSQTAPERKQAAPQRRKEGPKLEPERAAARKREHALERERVAERKRERALERERVAERRREQALERERVAERKRERTLGREHALERKRERTLGLERVAERKRESRPLPAKQNKAYRVAMKERSDRVDGTPLEAYISAEPRPVDEPVVIFQHIQKTSGTAIRQILHRNLQPDGTQLLIRDAPRQKGDEATLHAWYRDFHASLSDEQRAGLMCVACHSANHLLPLLERPTRAFTMLREPLDRVLSRYYFFRPQYRLTNLSEVFDNLGQRQRRFHFANSQSSSLMAPHWNIHDLPHSPDAPDADRWRERLFAITDQHYTVGLQDRFAESVELFARTFGWPEVFVPRVRVNRDRPRVLKDAELREKILAHNWLDVELYERVSESFASPGAAVEPDRPPVARNL